MSGLALGWAEARLGDVATTQLGRMLAAHRETGTYARPYLRNRDVQWGTINTSALPVMDFDATEAGRFRLEPGDVLVCEGGEVGRTAVWQGHIEECYYQKALHRVRTSPALAPVFLRYLMEHYALQRRFDPYTSGSTISHLPQEDLRNLPVQLPPRAEQDRVVAVIEEQLSRLDAGVEALHRARRKLATMRNAVLGAAVTGRLVAQAASDGTAEHLVAQALAARNSTTESAGRGKTIPLDYLHDHLPVIPGSWRWVSLDAIADLVGGITKDAKKQTAPTLVEVPYLRVANVQRGYLDLRSVATIKATREQVAALRLAAGDVLFNEGGDRDKLGRGWVWEGQIDPCIHQNHVFRARLFAPVLDPRLLSWHGNTFGQLWFDRGGRQTTNLASVSRTTLRSFPVPIPPLAEQRRIVAAVESYLSLIDGADVMVQAAEPRASALRTSLLASAFTGKLVSQDPDDEPASVLLGRIAADRVDSNGRMKVGARRQRVTS